MTHEEMVDGIRGAAFVYASSPGRPDLRAADFASEHAERLATALSSLSAIPQRDVAVRASQSLTAIAREVGSPLRDVDFAGVSKTIIERLVRCCTTHAR